MLLHCMILLILAIATELQTRSHTTSDTSQRPCDEPRLTRGAPFISFFTMRRGVDQTQNGILRLRYPIKTPRRERIVPTAPMVLALTVKRLMSFSLTSFIPAAGSAAVASPLSLAHAPIASSASRSGPFSKSAVKLSLSRAHNRLSHPDPLVEATIEQLWDAHKQRTPRIFNGTKLRLHGWRVVDAATPILELQCGLTDYKTYLGTCCSELVTQLRADGRKLYDGDAGAFLSRKIGVSAVLETSDQRVALIERSRGVGVYQQLFDTPGGHPEPSELPLTLETLEVLESDTETREEMETKALDRLFGSIVDEIHEEINVESAHLTEPLLLGVVWQSEAETPSFVFYLSTALSSADVDALYRLGPMDKFESTQLRWVDRHEASSHELPLTPAARGSLSLWQQYFATNQ